MTSFKSFRNRASQPRTQDDAEPLDGHDGESDNARRRDDANSTATGFGPQHLEILRQIESEGEPLSLAEEVAELTDRGDLERAAEALELLNKKSETHIAELQRMTMPQLLDEAR